MAKRMLAAAVAALMILALAGCTGSTPPPQTPGAPSDQGGSSTSSDPIKIGVLEDLSGDFSLVGTQKLHAAQLAVSEINAAGGLLGRQIEIIAPDAQSDTQRAQEMAKKLVLEDKVDVVMGCYTSAAREAVRPIFEDNKALLFYNNQYEGGVASKYVFCTGAVPEQQVVPLMEYMNAEFGKKVYIITADYNFGQICAEWFDKAVTANGGEIVGVEFVPLSVSQFSSSISKIQQASPDILIPMMVGNTQASFYEQWATTRSENLPMGSTGNIGQTYEHKRFAAPALGNMYITTNYVEEIDTEASNAFKDRWHAMFPDEPYIGMEAEAQYCGVYLWAEAVKQAGTTEVEAVIAALESGVSFEAPSGTVTIDGKTHHAIRDIYLMRCDDEHNLTEVKRWNAIEPDWLSKEMGIDLTVEAPNKQFTPLD